MKKILLDIDTFFNKKLSGIMRESYYFYNILANENDVDIKVPFPGRIFCPKAISNKPFKLFDFMVKDHFDFFQNEILSDHKITIENQNFYTFKKKIGPLQIGTYFDPLAGEIYKAIERFKNKFFDILLFDKIYANQWDFVIFPFLSSTKVIGAKKIVRHHDIIPIERIEKKHFTKEFYLALKKAVKTTDHFVCNSKDTEDKLLYFYPELKGKTSIIYVPVIAKNTNPNKKDIISIIKSSLNFDVQDPATNKEIRLWQKDAKDMMLNQYDIITRENESDKKMKYFIFISDITSRKNLDKILKAFSIASNKFKDYKLIVVSHNIVSHPFIPFILCNLINSGNAFYITDLCVKDLHKLIEEAEAVVSFSSHEGFGIPPAEALMLGTPIIVSDINVYKEIYNDAAIFARSNDYNDLAEKMITFIENGGKENWSLKPHVKNVIRKFSYDFVKDQWNDLVQRV